MKTLKELNNYKGLFLTAKGTLHEYLPVYDSLFTPFRNKKINIFEVGFLFGGSAKLWELYFSKAMIKVIDLSKTPPLAWKYDAIKRKEHVEIELSKKVSLEIKDCMTLTKEYIKDFIPDIAIEDGGHSLESQLHFVKIVYPVMNPGGLLIIEDVQDIDNQKAEFEKLGILFEIFDLRKSGRYDDVFILFRK
jgi:cephalosporin hydroxylase